MIATALPTSLLTLHSNEVLKTLGLIQIPAYDVRNELADGHLLEVMPAHRADPLPMNLLFPHRRHPSQRLRVFVDWLQGVLEAAVRA